MITTPNRVREAIAQIEAGGTVDWEQLRLLVPLDLVVAGRDFAEEAIQQNEAWDADTVEALRAIIGNT